MVGRVAKYWNMRPSQLRRLDATEQAELRAQYIVNQEIELYYSSESARLADNINKT